MGGLMEDVLPSLAGQGVIGVVCVILLIALRDIFGRLMDSQEKRINEAVENRTAVERNTSALTALTDVIKERRG